MNFNFKKISEENAVMATRAFFDVFEFNPDLELLKRLKIGKYIKFEEVKIQKIPQWRKRLEKKVVFLKKVLRWVPFVRFTAVCNFYDFDAIDSQSDIDLFVVTAKNRIFLAKIFLTIILHILRLRRHGNKIAGRFCLSFFVEEEKLALGDLLYDNDIYFYFWLLGLKPVYGDMVIWNEIYNKNKWVDELFDSFELRRSKSEFDKKRSLFVRLLEYILNNRFGDFVERRLEKLFVRRFNKIKNTLPENASVIVNKDILKFHNNDRRKLYRDLWIEKLKRLGIS